MNECHLASTEGIPDKNGNLGSHVPRSKFDSMGNEESITIKITNNKGTQNDFYICENCNCLFTWDYV